MKYESFLKLTLGLQKQERVVNELYKKKIDIIDFVDPYHGFITLLLTEIYGEEGYDWFSWFCYESDFGTKDWSLQDSYKYDKDGILVKAHEAGEARHGAVDEDGNPICYDWESLSGSI